MLERVTARLLLGFPIASGIS